MSESPYIAPAIPVGYELTADGEIRRVDTVDPDLAPEWLGGLKHFSASSLRLLKVCPEAYRQRYFLGKKERPGEALTMGKAVHSAVGRNYEQKIASHTDLSATEVVEYFHDEAWPQAVELDGGEEEIRWDKKPDDARRDGERVTRAHHIAIAPAVQPIEVEQQLVMHVPDVPIPFIGYIDTLTETHVIDLKTGKQVQRKPDANWRMQGAIYSAATRKATHFHCVSRAATPSIATPLTDPEMLIPYRDDIAASTVKVLQDYAAQVEYFYTKYGPDQYWPTSGVVMDYKGGPACRYCGFRKDCPAWEWERNPVVHP